MQRALASALAFGAELPLRVELSLKSFKALNGLESLPKLATTSLPVTLCRPPGNNPPSSEEHAAVLVVSWFW